MTTQARIERLLKYASEWSAKAEEATSHTLKAQCEQYAANFERKAAKVVIHGHWIKQ